MLHPADDAAPDHLRLGVVSCSNWEAGYFSAYRHLAGRGDLHAVNNKNATLLPEPSVQPVERVRLKSGRRKRASARKSPVAESWTWADDGSES